MLEGRRAAGRPEAGDDDNRAKEEDDAEKVTLVSKLSLYLVVGLSRWVTFIGPRFNNHFLTAVFSCRIPPVSHIHTVLFCNVEVFKVYLLLQNLLDELHVIEKKNKAPIRHLTNQLGQSKGPVASLPAELFEDTLPGVKSALSLVLKSSLPGQIIVLEFRNDPRSSQQC